MVNVVAPILDNVTAGIGQITAYWTHLVERQDINCTLIQIAMYQHQIVLLVSTTIAPAIFIQEEYLQLLIIIHLLQQLPVIL